jgi:hypothetical protein
MLNYNYGTYRWFRSFEEPRAAKLQPPVATIGTEKQKILNARMKIVLVAWLLAAAWWHLPAQPAGVNQTAAYDAYDSLGLWHNAVLARAEDQGLLYDAALGERAFATQLLALTYGPQAVALQPFTDAYDAVYDALPTPRERRRIGLYNALALDGTAIRYLEQLYALPDSLSYDQTLHALQTLRASVRQDAALPLAQKHLLQAVLAVTYHSARHWHAKDLKELSAKPHQKQPLYKPDSLRKVRWRKLMRADGYGVLKGTLFGLFFFGTAAWVWPRNFTLSVAGGLGIQLFFPIFESARYARRLRLGMLRLEDQPYDPPFHFKEAPPGKESPGVRLPPPQ